MHLEVDKLTIGCIPNSPDYNHPQDRRRYVPYFKAKGILYETAQYENDYDIIYISLSADLNLWCNYKEKQRKKDKDVRVILDLSDLYLVENNLKDMMRSVYHYLCKRTSVLTTSYKRTINKMIDSSDVIICGSLEQKQFLNQIHKNVIIVRDYFDDEITVFKDSYDLIKNNELHLLWEGFAHGNIEYFKMLNDILSPISSYKIHIHIITDSEYCKLGGQYFCRPTYSVLKETFKSSNISFHLYDWNSVTFNSIAIKCDLALIPIPNNPLAISKPENKLILLWLIGLPVVTSDTPSYTRVMRNINMDFTCNNYDKWRMKIVQLANSKALREDYMCCARKFIDNNYSKDSIFSIYDNIFFE